MKRLYRVFFVAFALGSSAVHAQPSVTATDAGVLTPLPSASPDGGVPSVSPGGGTTVQLLPPVAESTPPVDYPRSETTDARVVVETVVSAEGEVTVATSLSTDVSSTFQSAAVEGVRRYKFSPATRNGVPVPAKIRLEILFRAPTQKVVPPDPAPPPPVRSAKSVPVEAEQEINIRGRKNPPGGLHFTRAEVRTMPGAFGDAFRAVEAMPGVVPTVSGLPFFFIRGAPPGNIGYFLDEVRVPMLYHLALGPSVIHPAMMNEVEFYPGSSPARFGRFAGGILNGVTKEPEPKFGGEYNLRLLDAGGYIQFPFGPSKEGETKKGTVTIGGRYGYPGLLLPIFAPDTTLAYWDYQIRAAWKFDEKHRIELFSFGAYDFLGQIQRDSEYDNSGRYVGETSKNVTLFDMTFHRYDLRYDYTPSPQRRLRIAGTFGYDFSGADVGRGVDRVVGLRAMYEDKSNPKLELRGGANVLWDRFTIEDREENVIQEDEFGLLSPRNALASGAFIEAKWKITPRFELYPGLRIDHFLEVREQDPSTVTNGGFGSFVNGLPKTASRLALDPRLTVRLKIRENLLYTSTLGMQHQPPALAIPVPGIGLSRLSDGLQESFLWSHGVEMDLPWSLTLTSSVFGAAFYGLTDASATCDFTDNNGGNNEVDCISERVKGRAYGLELMIRRPVTKRLSGFLSYTLSRSTRQAHALATYVPDGDEGLRVIRNPEALQDVPSEFDRTHVLHFALGYDLGNRWRIGGRMVYYSGRPFTQSVRFNGVRIPIPPANGLRAPGFFRLDARLEKTWQFSDNARLSFVLEVLNSTLSKETVNVECRSPNESVDGGPIRDGVSSNSSTPPNDLSGLSICDRFTTIGPVTIPSIGIEGTF